MWLPAYLESSVTEIRIATRRSSLALAQATRVANLLTRHHPEVSIRLIGVETAGDRDATGDITSLTETGAFVSAVQDAVLDHRADIAVHSLKDLPVDSPSDLVLAAFPERASPLDVLVGSRLDRLPAGATVGTGSPRRSAQLLELRPDLETVGIRGNVDTRIRKVSNGDVDGAVLAKAGLDRLGQTHRIAQRFSSQEMVPAPGQGALAVEARGDSEAAEIAASIDDRDLRPLLTAERELLSRTGAGCRSALGALARWEGTRMRMELFVADDGQSRRASVEGHDIDEVVSAAREALAL
jgi:hydroxymethylbilane synthase